MKNKIQFTILLALFESCNKDRLEPAVSAEVKGYTLTRIQSQAAFSPRDFGGERLFNDSLWYFGRFTPDRSNEVWKFKREGQ